jgi:hypothetical protein
MVRLVILLPPFESYNDYLNLVRMVKPDIIAVTKNDPQIENKKKQAKKIGGKIVTVTPHFDNFSSSELIKKFIKFFF